MQQIPRRHIFAQVKQVLLVIPCAHTVHYVPVHMLGDRSGLLHRVEIRNQRNRNPVVVIDSLVARNDSAHLSGAVAAELYERLGTDAFKINRGMSGGIYGAEKTEGSSINRAA